MKYYFLFLMVFGSNFLSASNEPPKKLYLNPSNIFFQENKIFILHENGVYKVTSIHSDNDGLYVDDCFPMPFVCQRCGLRNPGTNFACERCGFPRPDYNTTLD
jgi:hypothetical protein